MLLNHKLFLYVWYYFRSPIFTFIISNHVVRSIWYPSKYLAYTYALIHLNSAKFQHTKAERSFGVHRIDTPSGSEPHNGATRGQNGPAPNQSRSQASTAVQRSERRGQLYPRQQELRPFWNYLAWESKWWIRWLHRLRFQMSVRFGGRRYTGGYNTSVYRLLGEQTYTQ